MNKNIKEIWISPFVTYLKCFYTSYIYVNNCLVVVQLWSVN